MEGSTPTELQSCDRGEESSHRSGLAIGHHAAMPSVLLAAMHDCPQGTDGFSVEVEESWVSRLSWLIT